jgi:hypothetical protein
MLPTSAPHEWIILVNALRPAITGENELLVQIIASGSSEAEGEDVNERSTAKIYFLRVEDHVKMWTLSCASLTETSSPARSSWLMRFVPSLPEVVQITASASSEAEGEALGADEPADEDID